MHVLIGRINVKRVKIFLIPNHCNNCLNKLFNNSSYIVFCKGNEMYSSIMSV